MLRIKGAILFAMMLSAQAQGAPKAPKPFDSAYTMARFALAGKKSTLGSFFSLKVDCSPMDWNEVKIVKPPKNGEAKLVDGTTFPGYTAPNPRTKCNEKSVNASMLEYTPAQGYAGPDSIQLESIDSGGSRARYTINITVK